MFNIQMDSKKANLLLMLVALIWGSGFIGSQLALDASLTPLQVITTRFFVASIILNIIFFKRFKSFCFDEIKDGCIIGFFLFLGFLFQTFGLQYSTPSINAFLTAAYVIIVPFLHFVTFKKKPDLYALIGAVITLAGVGFITLEGSVSYSIGIPLTLISAVAYAAQISVTEIFTRKYSAVNLTVIMINFTFIISLVVTAVMAIIFHDIPPFSVKGVASSLYIGILCTSLAFLMQNIGQKFTKAANAAIIMSLESVFATIMSVIIFHERFGIKIFIGCALIFCAILITEIKPNFKIFKKWV